MDLRHQLGLGWSRADVGQASRPARNDLAPVAIVDRNEHAERYQRDFCNMLVRVNLAMARLPVAAGIRPPTSNRRVPGSRRSWA